MKAYQIGDQTGLSGLRLAERADPQCGPGEVLVRVSRVCLNHRDLKILAGEYGSRRPADRTPCSDGVGVVEAVGPDVTGVAPGERVTCGHFVRWLDGAFSPGVFADDLGVTRDGWLAEKILVPASALVKAPEALSDAQVAVLPSAGVTAWHALVEAGRIRAGDLVLVLGTGGVSLLALQIAKLHGALVALTSSSDDKLARGRALGADFTVNYAKTPDWARALLEETSGRGADIVVETGGSLTLAQSLAAAAANGRIVAIGSLSGGFAVDLPNFSVMIGKNLVLKGIAAGNRRMLADLIRAVAAADLRPVIDKVFPFEAAALAYGHFLGGAHMGKVMIEIAP